MVVGIYRSVGLFFMLKGKIVSVSGSKKEKKKKVKKMVKSAWSERLTIERPYRVDPSPSLQASNSEDILDRGDLRVIGYTKGVIASHLL